MALAQRVASTFRDDAGAVAALVAGSVAAGASDEWSDIDLILFYDEWPGRDALDSARAALAPVEHVVLGGDIAGDAYIEQFRVDNVACQLVHQTQAVWRDTAATVLEQLDTSSPIQKALSGIHAGTVLFGDGVITALRSAAKYPGALRAAMVRDNLGIFPLWRMQDALVVRDAELWQRSELIAGLQKVLGILAGVNAVFFSTFQLKHMRELVAAFRTAPIDLAARIEAALTAPMPDAAVMLESLVGETVAIVERELPEVDVSPLRRSLGQRLEPW
jgi:hypothetical protein